VLVGQISQEAGALAAAASSGAVLVESG